MDPPTGQCGALSSCSLWVVWDILLGLTGTNGDLWESGLLWNNITGQIRVPAELKITSGSYAQAKSIQPQVPITVNGAQECAWKADTTTVSRTAFRTILGVLTGALVNTGHRWGVQTCKLHPTQETNPWRSLKSFRLMGTCTSQPSEGHLSSSFYMMPETSDPTVQETQREAKVSKGISHLILKLTCYLTLWFPGTD